MQTNLRHRYITKASASGNDVTTDAAISLPRLIKPPPQCIVLHANIESCYKPHKKLVKTL